MDKVTSESICLNAVLISLYTLFLRSEPSDEPYELPLLWLSMARGVRTVLSDVYYQLLESKSRLCPLLEAQPTIWKEKFTAYKGPSRPFQCLLDYRYEEDQIDEATLAAYRDTVAYLERFYISSENNEPPFTLRRIFSGFPALVPKRFLDLITNQDPRALVITAYMFALAKKVEDIWWLRGIPEREVRGINNLIPKEWKWAMDWPLSLVSQMSSKEPGNRYVASRSVIG